MRGLRAKTADGRTGRYDTAFIGNALLSLPRPCAETVGLLVALCASLLGVSLVLKRFSMIGDGLSHVGFGALAIASVLNIAPRYLAIPVCIAASFLLLRLSESTRIKGDAAIAMLSAGSLAVGVMVVSMTTGMNTDVYNYMFGSILSLSKEDAVLSIVLCALVLVLFVLFYPRLFAVTFDESFARATGIPTSAYNAALAVLSSVTVVLGMRMMGALLISSLGSSPCCRPCASANGTGRSPSSPPSSRLRDF